MDINLINKSKTFIQNYDGQKRQKKKNKKLNPVKTFTLND